MGNTVSDGFPSPDGSAKKSVGITPDAPSQKLLTSGEEVNANVPVLDNNEAIIKSLPAGLWGKYDPAKDPRSHANSKDLLNGNGNTTVSLMCGVTISVPKALVSELDRTYPFNYQKFMVLEIEEVFEFPSLADNYSPFLPAKPDQPPPSTPSKQWDNVRTAWENPSMGDTAPPDAVKLWQNIGLSELGWDPAKVDDKTGETLSGQIPADLVKNLEDYYLWAPFLSTA